MNSPGYGSNCGTERAVRDAVTRVGPKIKSIASLQPFSTRTGGNLSGGKFIGSAVIRPVQPKGCKGKQRKIRESKGFQRGMKSRSMK
jgi:hypothetical protein